MHKTVTTKDKCVKRNEAREIQCIKEVLLKI